METDKGSGRAAGYPPEALNPFSSLELSWISEEAVWIQKEGLAGLFFHPSHPCSQPSSLDHQFQVSASPRLSDCVYGSAPFGYSPGYELSDIRVFIRRSCPSEFVPMYESPVCVAKPEFIVCLAILQSPVCHGGCS